jgi:serine/threonine protein kinase
MCLVSVVTRKVTLILSGYDVMLIVIKMSMSIEDFALLSVIGKGTYAKVLLVKHVKTDQVYAMKVLKKKYIAEKKQ